MKAILFLLCLIGLYYLIYKKEWIELTTKNHIQMIITCLVYLFIYYLLTKQKDFVYKMVKNINNTDSSQFNNHISLQNDQLKYSLSEKQNHRCYGCHNPVYLKDIDRYSINYKVPLQFGGTNDVHNLGLFCPSCTSVRYR
tara:strand:+ start:1012 stop:1431 length:420 start_codon:yes stop_codon:yes gene_type:complete